MVTGPGGGLDRGRAVPVAAAGPDALAMGVALPAQELGDLGLDGGLHQQAHPEAGHLLEDLAELTLGGEQVVDVGADALDGDTRVDTGVGSFLCLQGLKGTYARSSIYTADGERPDLRPTDRVDGATCKE